jgi:hypothetical protein
MSNEKKPFVYRDQVIAVRVTPDFYDDLKFISNTLELPVSLLCYLAVKKYVAERTGGKYDTKELDLI